MFLWVQLDSFLGSSFFPKKIIWTNVHETHNAVNVFSEPEACIDKMEIPWGKFISLAIHLAPAIIGQRSWVAARENEKLSTQSPPLQFKNFNYIIHCETFGEKVLKMEHVMSIILLTGSFFLFQTSQSLPKVQPSSQEHASGKDSSCISHWGNADKLCRWRMWSCGSSGKK